MLTRTGVVTTIVACLLALIGRVFGFLELLLIGAGLLAVVLVSVVWVRVRRVRVEVRRTVVPARVDAGQPAQVDLEISALDGGRSPVLELTDPVTGTRGARLQVAPLRGGERTLATYQLPTARRGVVEVGPLTLTARDPFGMSRRSFPAVGVARLVVYPRIDAIAPLRRTLGTRTLAGADRGASHADRGDDFHALRPYVVGDDLRRVHWPSTARHDQLMVRQDRHPRQGRLTVVLDVDAATMHPEALDEAVSVAASVLSANRRRGDLVRLVTGDATDSGYLREAARLDAVLEYLAVVQPRRGATFLRAIEQVLAEDGECAVVTVTGPLDELARRALDRLRPVVTTLTSVEIDPSAWDPDAISPAVLPNPRQVVVTGELPFAAAWTAAFNDRTPAPTGGRR